MRTDRPPDEKNNPPSGMTPEQVDEYLEKKLGATVNNMLTARMATFEKKLQSSLGSTVGDALKAQLPELLKEFAPPKREEEPDGKGGKGGKGGKDDPELATLRQQLAALAGKTADAEAKANALREKSRTQAIREQVRSFLGKAGIDGDRFDAAYALLDHSGRIVKAEDPESDDAFFRDHTSADPVVLEVGLQGWLKSDQAKIFLPPTGMRGGGSRPGTRGGDGKPPSPEQVRSNVAAALVEELGR